VKRKAIGEDFGIPRFGAAQVDKLAVKVVNQEIAEIPRLTGTNERYTNSQTGFVRFNYSKHRGWENL
jgi:hypothetical protein